MGEDAKGMVLPFKPLNITFSHMWYSVDFPKVSIDVCRAFPSRAERSHQRHGRTPPQLCTLLCRRVRHWASLLLFRDTQGADIPPDARKDGGAPRLYLLKVRCPTCCIMHSTCNSTACREESH